MKGQTLLNAIGEIDDAFVYEAEQRQKSRWKWGAIAAILVLTVLSLWFFLPRSEEKTLPILTVSEDWNSGMGYEGYLAYDVSELVSANPWRKDLQLETLPVYRNLRPVSEAGPLYEADPAEQRRVLYEAAALLGIDAQALSVVEADTMEAHTEGISFTAGEDLSVRVSFEPSIALPQEYNFSYDASYEEMTAVADYLQKAYPQLVGNLQRNIYGGDYDIYGTQGYHISFFDARGDVREQIVNFQFPKVTFSCNEDGKLWLIRLSTPDLSEKMGDYPIIDMQEATTLLQNGNYATSVPYAFAGTEHIAKVELIYRVEGKAEYYMPYYRFYVELPEETHHGELKTYGAYYVPAVEAAYLSNMPVYDGSFN